MSFLRRLGSRATKNTYIKPEERRLPPPKHSFMDDPGMFEEADFDSPPMVAATRKVNHMNNHFSLPPEGLFSQLKMGGGGPLYEEGRKVVVQQHVSATSQEIYYAANKTAGNNNNNSSSGNSSNMSGNNNNNNSNGSNSKMAGANSGSSRTGSEAAKDKRLGFFLVFSFSCILISCTLYL
jgi:hypothetical protein